MATNRDRFALIESISTIGSEASDDLRETLDRIVGAIASSLEVEVCSLYLFDPQHERLVLRATIGLDRDSVGRVSMRMSEGLVGLAASPGFARGVAHVVGTFLSSIDRNLRIRDTRAEIRRLEEALTRSRAELAALKIRMEPLMPETELKIFDGHRLILEDEEFVGRIREAIENGYAAESALFRVIDELSAQMLALADSYLRERATDFRDVGHRVLRHLRQEDKKNAFGKATILIADELTLSQMTLVSHENLVGIALQSGGVTSHAAILARAFEIPTVVGVEHLMEALLEGDALVIDGNSGIVYVNPSSEVEREYQLLMKRYDAFRKELLVDLDQPTVTRDGHRVEMLANIALPADIALAIKYGAEGIGLLRSEFSFLTYEDIPYENQH